MPKEIEKKKFEVKFFTKEDGQQIKRIFIDDELLDWEVDISSFREAQKMGHIYKVAVQKDIAQHFIDSVSEVLGRKITIEQIKEATKTGWI